LCGTRVRLRSLFDATGQCYGSRRLRKELAEQGIEIGRHRVRSLMKELQLKPIWKPKFVHTTDSNHNLPVYENVLDRQFEQPEANRAWVSDITYIRTLSGWLLVPCGYIRRWCRTYFREKSSVGPWRPTCQPSGSARLCRSPWPSADRRQA
jgi:transposase InsO family protein